MYRIGGMIINLEIEKNNFRMFILPPKNNKLIKILLLRCSNDLRIL